jgi:hypothetical protein
LNRLILLLIMTLATTPDASAENPHCQSKYPYFRFDSNKFPTAKEMQILAHQRPGALLALNPLSSVDTFKNAGEYFEKVMPSFSKVVANIKAQGLHPAAYLEGPHGMTAGKWTGGEKQRMQALSKTYCKGAKHDCWLKEGWIAYTKDQLKALSKMGVEAIEIDNIANDWNYSQEATRNSSKELAKGLSADVGAPNSVVQIYKNLAKWMKEQNPPIRIKIIPKNLTPAELKGLQRAISSSELSRDDVADFHIAEKLEDDKHHEDFRNRVYRELQAQESAKLGIQLVGSDNTEDYRSEGEYDKACGGQVAIPLPGAPLPGDNIRRRPVEAVEAQPETSR